MNFDPVISLFHFTQLDSNVAAAVIGSPTSTQATFSVSHRLHNEAKSLLFFLSMESLHFAWNRVELASVATQLTNGSEASLLLLHSLTLSLSLSRLPFGVWRGKRKPVQSRRSLTFTPETQRTRRSELFSILSSLALTFFQHFSHRKQRKKLLFLMNQLPTCSEAWLHEWKCFFRRCHRDRIGREWMMAAYTWGWFDDEGSRTDDDDDEWRLVKGWRLCWILQA